MKKRLIIYKIIVIFAIATGCSNDSSDHYPFPTYEAENYTGLAGELSRAKFDCQGSREECALSVGLMMTNISSSSYTPKISQCTGFLINEDVVATNSHCIPDRVKLQPATCKTHVGIRFLKNDKVFMCEQILEFSSLGFDDPDYAFFKIKPTGIKPLQIHKAGMNPDEKLRVTKVTPHEHFRGGSLGTQECILKLGTLLNLNSGTPWSQTGVALGCNSTGGNSGAPVLNSSGKVVGILQSRKTKNYNKFIESNFKKFNVKLPSKIQPHFIFTNLSCVADPVTTERNSEYCDAAKQLNMISCVDFQTEGSAKNISYVHNKWKKDLPDIFLYEIKQNPKHSTLSALPICVKPQPLFEEYESYVSLKGIFGFRKETIALTYPSTVKTQTYLKVNEHYQLSDVINMKELFRSSHEIFLQKTDDLWTGHFTGSSIRIQVPFELHECSAEEIEEGSLTYIENSDGEIIPESEVIYSKEDMPEQCQ